MKLYIKFTIILLFPIILNSEEYRKKVFFDRIAMDIGKSVPEEIVIRVVSEIGETIVQAYSNEYQYIDESVQQSLYKKLKEQQMFGCNTEACIKMIEDNIDADFKITAKLRKRGDKYLLLLKKIDQKKYGEVVSQQDIEFTPSMLEYFTHELTRAIMQKGYKIKNPNDPSKLLFSNYFWKSALFPGYGQIDLKRQDSRGTIFSYLGIGVLGFTAFQYALSQKSEEAYLSVSPVPVYFLVSAGNTELAYLYSNSSYSGKRSEYQSSVNLFNTGVILYSILWSANLIDLLYFSQTEKAAMGRDGRFEISQTRSVIPIADGQKQIDAYSFFSYTIRF
jgi:hypothetical protein